VTFIANFGVLTECQTYFNLVCQIRETRLKYKKKTKIYNYQLKTVADFIMWSNNQPMLVFAFPNINSYKCVCGWGPRLWGELTTETPELLRVEVSRGDTSTLGNSTPCPSTNVRIVRIWHLQSASI